MNMIFGFCCSNSCGDITTCRGIKGRDCGWCTSAGEAYPGNEAGAGGGFACGLGPFGGWIWYSDDCD
jgi:hypothetical protein